MRRRKANMEPDDPQLLLNNDTSLVAEVKQYLNVIQVKRWIGLGTELFGAASSFLEKPSWWTAGKSMFAMGKVMVEDVEVWAEDYFGGDEWTEPYSTDFNQTLIRILQKFPYERFKTNDENMHVRVCTLPSGVKTGWMVNGKSYEVENIYVETVHLESAKADIKQLLWDQFKGRSLVMRQNNRISINGREPRVIFEVDDVFASQKSKRAMELAEQLQKPLDNNVSRSIMFYGPPGTGKSTLARAIIELMGLRSFRIRIADLEGLNNGTLFEAINIFKPDAVILDDFDRASNQSALLETLEFFQQSVKLVITTVNNRHNLDNALLRPGRVDILEQVDTMDEEVVKHVLGDFADGFELVKEWPIAYINEYVKRRTYMSVEEAAESVKELTRRVEEMMMYEDDGDLNRMAKMLQQASTRVAHRVNRIRKAVTNDGSVGGMPASNSHKKSKKNSD